MKVLQMGVAGVALVSLAGCSMFGSDNNRVDYSAAAQKVHALEVPPDLILPATDERYQIPSGAGTGPNPSADTGPAQPLAGVATYSAYSKGIYSVPAVSGVAAASSVAAINTIEPAGTASLRQISDDKTIIAMNDPFDRAWRKVGLALEGAGLVVEDKDREKGIYYLRPVRVDRGWLDKLAFWKSDEDTSRHYRVIVKDGGASCAVSIVDQDGASNKVSKQMLGAVYKNINQQQ